jgi:hypothetical protein
MEGIEKPHMDKYKDIMNDWNYDASCTLASLLVWNLENSEMLDFCCTECTKNQGSKQVGHDVSL